MTLFVTTLGQMGYLFSFMLIGFLLAKLKAVPDNAATVLSKMESNFLIPALVLDTFIKNFNRQVLASTGAILLLSLGVLVVCIPLTMLLSRLCTRDGYLRNVYTFGLSFSNFAFMGYAVVQAVFPQIYYEYVIFTLSIWFVVYLWGMPELLIADAGKKRGIGQRLKDLCNPMFICMIVGMVLGYLEIPLPSFAVKVIETGSACMSPLAMVLTGMTLAYISLKRTFGDPRVYLMSFFKLLLLPLAFLLLCKLLPVTSLPMGETFFLCTLCSLAMPYGLNAIVILASYGKDTSVPAGLALVTHLFSCLTIPMVFLLI